MSVRPRLILRLSPRLGLYRTLNHDGTQRWPNEPTWQSQNICNSIFRFALAPLSRNHVPELILSPRLQRCTPGLGDSTDSLHLQAASRSTPGLSSCVSSLGSSFLHCLDEFKVSLSANMNTAVAVAPPKIGIARDPRCLVSTNRAASANGITFHCG